MGYDRLEDFVDDRGEDSLVVVLAQGAVNGGEGINAGTGKDTAGDVDHLEIFGAGQGGDVAGFGADVVGDGGFEPGDDEMGSWKDGLAYFFYG